MAKPTKAEEALTQAAEYAAQLTQAGARGRVSVEPIDGDPDRGAVVVERDPDDFARTHERRRFPA